MTSRESTQATQNLKSNAVPPNPPGELEVDDPLNTKPVEISARTGKPKRRKAVRACTNCQRTHLTCDDDRPCERCIKRGCADTCVDGKRRTPKRARAKAGKTSDHAEYPSDLLASQGPLGALVFSQDQPHLHHLHHYNLSRHSVSNPPIPDMSSSLYLHMSQQAHPHLYPNDSKLLIEGSHSGVGASHFDRHGHERGESHSHYSPTNHHRASHESLSASSGSSEHPHQFESYRMLPEYSGPTDSFPLPSQSPLQRYAEAIHGTKGTTKEESVISAMLQRRGEEGEEGPPDPQQASDESNGYEGSCSNDEDSSNTMPWLEAPTNPLVIAHNEQSRRFSYNYEHTDPSEVYKRVTEPFPNRQSFHNMVAFLKNRLDQAQFRQLMGSLSKLKAYFDSISRPLSNDDNLFVEQSFQRSLLEEEKQFALTPVPCLVWRRTGVVTAVSPRFTKLTQWTSEDLKSEFLMRALSNESIMRYFENFQSASLRQSSDFKFDCTLITHSGKEILTEAEVTIRKDLFNLPLTLLGRFWIKS